MAWSIFDRFMERQHDGNGGNLDAAGDTLKCMLLDDIREPVDATDIHTDDMDANEVSGTNYTAGGETLANQVITLAAGTVTFDGDDIVWSASGTGFADARYAVIYIEADATPANDRVICYADLGGNVGNTSGDLTLEMNASGIWILTNA
ncbi:MAG: hypothetical protein WBC22_15370 [Sedimentisphaerales bacterium]